MMKRMLTIAVCAAVMPSLSWAQSCSSRGGAGSCSSGGGGAVQRPIGQPGIGQPGIGQPGVGQPWNGGIPGNGVPGYGSPTYGGAAPTYGGTPSYGTPYGSSRPAFQSLSESVRNAPNQPTVAEAESRREPAAKNDAPEIVPNDQDEEASELAALEDLFSDFDSDARFNLEVRDPVGTDYRVVKEDLSMKQASKLGDQLAKAFWVVSRGEGSQPSAKMVPTRQAAVKAVRDLAAITTNRPLVESITYRIVPQNTQVEEGFLSGMLETAFETPTSPSDYSGASMPDLPPLDEESNMVPMEEWVGISVGSNGRPKKFTLRLDADGQAEISVPTTEGESQKIRSRYKMDGDQLVLTGDGGKKTVFGRIINKDDQKMTLARSTGQITMFRQ